MATGLPDYFSRVFSEMLLQFTDLQDTPGSYAAKANKNVRVNAVESGLEFGGAYFDAGLDADKGAAGRKGRVWWAANSKILYYDDGSDWIEILRSEAVSRLASLAEQSFASLTNVNVDGVHGLLADDQHVLDSEVQAHPGVVKAWVKFNGTTATIAGSFNVSSVVRVGAAHYRVYWDVDFADATYCVVVSAGNLANGAVRLVCPITQDVGYIDFYTVDSNANPQDSDTIFVQAIGSQ